MMITSRMLVLAWHVSRGLAGDLSFMHYVDLILGSYSWDLLKFHTLSINLDTCNALFFDM